MRSPSLPAPTSVSTDPFVSAISDRDEALARINAASSALREELAACSAQANGVGRESLRLAVRGLAREISSASRPNRRDPWVADVLGFIKVVTDVGGHDQPASNDEVMLACEYLSRGWTGVLAAMLVVPSWQLPEAPALDAVPDWLWGDYTGWLFTAPLRFATAERDVSSDCDVKRTQDLERWVSRNTGSASIRAAIASYLQAAGSVASRTNFPSWRQVAESRGTILTRAHVRGRVDYDPPVAPRHGRQLRVGFIARDFGPRADVYATLPCFEQIDPKAFDIFLFPFAASESAEAAYCSRRARATQVLPAGTLARVETLRNAQLDVVIFVGDLGGEWNEVTELALHRVAPLQAVNHRSGFSTGLPEIDLYICGAEPTATCPVTAFTERVGVLRGPAHSIAFAQTGSAAAETPGATRETVGLPADRSLLVTLVDSNGASQALVEKWVEILARTENAHLAIAFAHEGSGTQLMRFCAAIDRVIAEQAIDPTRVTIFPTSASQPHEARALISLADIFIDANPGTLAGWAAVEAMRAGVPAIAIGNPESHAPAAILTSAGLPELVASDLASYGALISALASDAERRTALRAKINTAIEATPDFLDSLAASDAFAALIESAFDELASLGRAEFRRQSDPVRCFSVDNPAESVEAGLAAHASGEIESAAMDANLALRTTPADTRVRYLHGLVLHAQGNTSRAVDYLLAAVQGADATPPMWYSLALALRDNRQVKEAIQVLETCIRLDNRNVDALLTLHELAEAAGATEIARDVLECLQQVAPEDPRVIAMS